MTMQPEPTTWRVVRINEDERRVAVTLRRTEWAKEIDPDDENTALSPAEAGEPGAFWTYDGENTEIVLTLPSLQAVMFDVGRQYVLGLQEIVDAPTTEYEPA